MCVKILYCGIQKSVEDYLVLLVFTTNYEKFAIQHSRTRLEHFCILVDRKLEVFSDITLIKNFKKNVNEVIRLPLG